jgi:hypothetical protein
VLEGDRNLPGNFSYAVFLPAGVYEHHWHSGDARVFVVKGALKVGFSEHFDKSVMKSYPAGSFVFVPANAKHTMGSRRGHGFLRDRRGPVGHARGSSLNCSTQAKEGLNGRLSLLLSDLL